ncbi:MAG: ABC transporter ATP-binding protein [Treponema sp.]|jgi:oligopeptide/dipeptide ABC transporter ATP-binding protein|nr:ABC transporter ATP-binding protein [Treponema sp.]
MPLLTISGLHKRFNLEAGFFARLGRFVNAVNGVSFSIGKNEAYGLVGESGCGKTTTARLLVRMYEADGGNILYHREEGPVEVGSLQRAELRQYRQKVRYVFQDPARSLNPRMSIREILLSGLKWSGIRGDTTVPPARQFHEKAALALEEVGLSGADLDRRPTEFSGGQRQRISIARGLLPQPELLICDEVVSALDVSIQAQILNLLLDIREKRIRDNRTMSFLFIAHDLKVACYFCDRIGVMYSGELMEEAPAASLWHAGQHPYTRMLFASATSSTDASAASSAAGINSPARPVASPPASPNVDAGAAAARCAFAGLCSQAAERCFQETPLLREIATGHTVRCHLV